MRTLKTGQLLIQVKCLRAVNGALETKGEYLLVEDGFGLSTITRLFTVITTFTLSSDTVLTLLVLGDLVQGVLLALLALAVGLLCLWNVHLREMQSIEGENRWIDEAYGK